MVLLHSVVFRLDRYPGVDAIYGCCSLKTTIPNLNGERQEKGERQHYFTLANLQREVTPIHSRKRPLTKKM